MSFHSAHIIKRIDRNSTKFMNKLLRDEQGATAIEYGLIAALVSVAAVVALENTGNLRGNMYNSVSGKLTTTASK